jgi:hypothetical protein
MGSILYSTPPDSIQFVARFHILFPAPTEEAACIAAIGGRRKKQAEAHSESNQSNRE